MKRARPTSRARTVSRPAKKIKLKTIHLKAKITRAKKVKIDKKLLEEQRQQDLALEDMRKTGEFLEHKPLLEHINKSVGSGSVDILRALVKAPKTDEDVAVQLNLKVNDVRRMLNVMNGYSIVRYDVNKDNKGWLIFKWRIDREKLGEFIANMESETSGEKYSLPTNTNDFFYCKKCYPTQKEIHPFDSAFEYEFSCNSCGKPFVALNREQTEQLFKQN